MDVPDDTTYELMLYVLPTTERHINCHFIRPDGTVFKALNQQFKAEGEVKPKEGDIVTFTYESYSRRAVPVNPKIYRIRKDTNWEQVVSNFQKDLVKNGIKGNLFLPLISLQNSPKLYTATRTNLDGTGFPSKGIISKISSRNSQKATILIH